jgi:hypothetical protein
MKHCSNKNCSKQGQLLSKDNFYITNNKYSSQCKSCKKQYGRNYDRSRHNDPKRKAHQKKYHQIYHLKYDYDLSVEDHDKMLKQQNGCCKICNVFKEEKYNRKGLFVDHCHATNKVRGLLCSACNHLLGMVKDDTQILEAAIRYLKESKEQ